MKRVVTAILGGGQGARLAPLTRDRAKPAVPVGGKFRLIDIPISNSLHAGIDKVYVLTQFNSESLHRHIAQSYRFDAFRGGFVNLLAAEQNMTNRSWYQGTADAVRQNLTRLIDDNDPTEVLILSGDQLYLMEMREFVLAHRANQADLTIAVKPVTREEAKGFGILRLDRTGRVVEFVEKPTSEEALDALALDESTRDALGFEAAPGTLLASMGIYVFRPEVLREVLVGSPYTDFGKEVIPASLGRIRVFAFPYDGYWTDIGTIPSFHQANLDLTVPLPSLNLYNPNYPIYTHARFLPGTKINGCSVTRSVLCEGSIITGAKISDSIVGIRAIVQTGTTIDRSIIMGANRFEPLAEAAHHAVKTGIGRDCTIRNAIIDFNARIGDGCKLLNEQKIEEAETPNYSIRGGIIVVPKNAELPPGTVI
ncbi:MAG: glucose-1-phosphate adenylyltransferase [Thermoanaerobaculia bacterium]|jgi:glucose-1-phosphate adenylyltransferase|nr:glucose-1-phosphate adenylyltransferase [Thermoanaerobaculia bacterium]MBP9824686.1 glucose-1-phosphate adenylyltransferase [Thermoanaerobaculia bacterium]